MGKKIERNRSKTLPSSPTHSFSSSSSSSDFEFRISISPRKSSAALCPADELFYKGKILPLHTSPRISMVRTLLLASSSTSSSSDTTTTTASRDSSSSNDSTSSSFATDLSLLASGDPCCDSNRPSSATDDDNNTTNNNNINISNTNPSNNIENINIVKRPTNKKTSNNSATSTSSKKFSLSRFSNVFKKDINVNANVNTQTRPPRPAPQPNKENLNNVKKINSSAKEVIRKYLKKVKPLYEKLSSKHHPGRSPCVGGMSPVLESTSSAPLRTTSTDVLLKLGTERSTAFSDSLQVNNNSDGTTSYSQSFSGNLKCSKMVKRGYVASCPSSMRSSPSHSGVLSRTGQPVRPGGSSTSQASCSYSSDASTMEELQNAIQGAIAHCKSSMLQSSTSSFNTNVNYHNNNNIINNKCKAFEI